MKKIILLLVLVFSSFSFSQDFELKRPDYKSIEKSIKDKKSNLNFEILFEKYQKGDTTMTIEEKRHLYYGFTFQKKYSSTYTSSYDDKLMAILKKDKLEPEDFEKIIEYGNEILKINPFDINVLDYLIYSYDIKKDNVNYNLAMGKLKIIIDAILSSGNGDKLENPLYVINVPHEYFILKILGFNYGGSQSLIGNCDYLKVEENKYKIEGLYFDISPSLENLAKILGK